MKFIQTPLSGAFVVEPEPRGDDRGHFARVFCADEFRAHGLCPNVVQANTSYSRARGTLRGMHYQLPPRAETKLVRCTRGAVHDVILDLRAGSTTFGRWFGAELSGANSKMMYVPAGFAHGFLTLTDDAEVLYLVSEFYSPDLERGVRWDDPRFGIAWPFEPAVISQRDRSHPLFDPAFHLGTAGEDAT